MCELTDALRRFADDLDAGRPVRGVDAIGLVTAGGGAVHTTFFGRSPVPAQTAAICLLAAGIGRLAAMATQPALSIVRGSTH